MLIVAQMSQTFAKIDLPAPYAITVDWAAIVSDAGPRTSEAGPRTSEAGSRTS